jgi:hypothetical protein
MKTYFTVLALSSSLIACTTSRCKVDKEFVQDYQRHLQIIIKEERGDSTDIDEYRNTLIYFYKVTGILPRADYSSTIGYRDKSKFEDDIVTLNVWLKNNKCQFTKIKSDSLLRAHSLGQ